eukprot:CAMPEP_0175768556 /NCGR_PEP_ID=MMETSP0097-20121207/70492_1 /TAXON_ID=311494 /ORGANISM="Alexandrium monilatum, Strain CCMP3105" /LENGTH=94 /DNA_ID=CAMNT_0017078677 /DNA_START=57 /DNA_END=338 /DNA_ORIENTATION=-
MVLIQQQDQCEEEATVRQRVVQGVHVSRACRKTAPRLRSHSGVALGVLLAAGPITADAYIVVVNNHDTAWLGQNQLPPVHIEEVVPATQSAAPE